MSPFKRKKENRDEPLNKEVLPDIVLEQMEKSHTSIFCPESIKDENLKDVRKNPERYLEVNMVTNARIVDSFFIPISSKHFNYKKRKYVVKQEFIYLMPTKYGYFMPTSFFRENDTDIKSFKKTNTGITGKAMSLLYDENLYVDLFSGDDAKYNFFIVVLQIISLIVFSAALYLLFFYEPEQVQAQAPKVVQTLFFAPWRFML